MEVLLLQIFLDLQINSLLKLENVRILKKLVNVLKLMRRPQSIKCNIIKNLYKLKAYNSKQSSRTYAKSCVIFTGNARSHTVAQIAKIVQRCNF